MDRPFAKIAKGKLISKWFMRSSISSKKQTNEFVFTSMRIVSFIFWRKVTTSKNHFEINLPLTTNSKTTNPNFFHEVYERM